MPIDFSANNLLALPHASLGALRTALLREIGPGSAAFLQEAGYAGGESIFSAFRTWLQARGDSGASGTAAEPEDLEVEAFQHRVAEFFKEAGWGTLRIGTLRDAVATIDCDEWGEADAQGEALDQPGCHLSTGLVADFFGRIADQPLAVLEVECRSMGYERCRFLLGNAEVMEHVYEELGRGAGYEEALEAVE